MSNVERIPSLIDDIYDAAVDPSLWPSVLCKSRDFVGGSGASVFSKDGNIKSLNVFHQCGSVDPHFTQLYLDQYVKLDPTTTAHVMCEIGQPICTADIMDVEDFRRTRIHQEWARPQGLVDMVAAVLDRTATGATLFGVFRDHRHGPANDDTRQRMRQITPHIRRAMLIAKAIEMKAAKADALAETLDGLSAGMFLVDRDGRMVHANASGQILLDDGAALSKSNGRIRPTDAAAGRTLKDIVAAASHGDKALNAKGIAVPLTGRDGERYAAHVLPLTAGARRLGYANHAAVAAVFVRKAEIEAPLAPEIIASHYQLTPTELRVLLAIVDIGGVRETSEALGIGESTVKTHLHRVYGKTGASRQADLVKLVASFSSPLAS
jgi:DNA-binding CsgD family transcriptional regulator